MKQTILFIFISILFLSGRTQNLVLNPSFESVNTGSLLCSWYVAQSEFNAAINNWTMPTDGSTDIFHTSLATSCFCSPYSTHTSAVGQQTPRTGNSMSAVTTYGNGGCAPSYREYLQGQLSTPMVAGQQYCIEFYISMADYNTYATNNIGVYFSTSSIYSATMCPYSVTPHVNSTAINTNATGWTLLSFTFTPTAAYTRFMIGNFYSDAATSISNVGGSRGVSRYFIDDVSIQLCTTNPVITLSNTSICSGQSATLTPSSTISGTTYAWNTGATSNSITVSPTTTTTYTVTGTSPSGGTGTASATVTVNPTPGVSVSASPTSVCSGQSSTLTASGASTYAWSTGGTGSSINVTPSSASTYVVTGTSAAGCTNTASVTVNVNTSPVISLSGTAICAGQNASLTASGAAVYQWNTGAGTASITVNPSSTTTYTVTGTNAVGCTSTASATVTVNPLPVVSVVASPTSVCPGNNSTITATGASTYNWSNGSSGTSIVVNPTASTTYSVTGTSAAGCTSTQSVTVGVLPGPIVAATGGAICEGDSIQISASGAVNYLWDNGSTGNLITVSPTATTTYTVSGTDGSGCTGIANVSVTVNPLPSIVVNQPQACLGDSVVITASATGTLSYLWSNGASTTSIAVQPLTSTSYTVTGVDANGCSNTAQSVVTIHALPLLSTQSNPDYCSSSNGSAQVIASGNSPFSYEWNTIPAQNSDSIFGLAAGSYSVTVTDANGCEDVAQVDVLPVAGFTLQTSSQPEHCGLADGSISVSVNGAQNPLTYSWSHNPALNNATASGLSQGSYTITVSDGLCMLTITADVLEQNGPDAGFHPSSTVVSLDQGSVTFSDQSFGANSWYYYFGDGTGATDQNPEHVFTEPGIFTVTQIVMDEWGCIDSVSVQITVNEGFAFFVPSAFSPNGDGLNDYFQVSGFGIDLNTFVLRVYDRWGRVVFITTDINSQWDGQLHLANDIDDVSQGVYSYHIFFKTSEGKDKEYFGKIIKLP